MKRREGRYLESEASSSGSHPFNSISIPGSQNPKRLMIEIVIGKSSNSLALSKIIVQGPRLPLGVLIAGGQGGFCKLFHGNQGPMLGTHMSHSLNSDV